MTLRLLWISPSFPLLLRFSLSSVLFLSHIASLYLLNPPLGLCFSLQVGSLLRTDSKMNSSLFHSNQINIVCVH